MLRESSASGCDPNRSTRAARRAALVGTVAIVLAACGGAAGDSATTEPATVGASSAAAPTRDTAPEGEFVLFDGASASFADFAGRPLVVNFWASWCPSCVAEMSAAFRPVEREVGDEVTFLGLNIQDQRQAALRLLEETGVEWVSAEDPNGSLYTALGGLGMPFTVLIDEAGVVVDRHNGPLSQSQLRNKLAELFGL